MEERITSRRNPLVQQVKKLLDLQADYFQGYYFSKPVNGENFLKYISTFEAQEV